ncbi:mechanosensitive ion channel protein MscS [Acidihalobacter ferrooxydans]|uniref:Small-conductance mechanosensitive channel n=2 Tax=Acidihalobacter ferrooxydans TaxID=1765967 RepID=A0A1P8UL67_9GAMM|nr:mechanosensitive ion channel protein MscS [Acidihalobacter ferrooxydans]
MLLLRYALLAYLRRAGGSGTRSFSATLAESLRLPLTLLALAVSLFLLDQLLVLFGHAPARLHLGLGVTAKIVLLAALIVFADNLAFRLIKHYAARSDVLRTSHAILAGVARVVVLGLGLLIVLGSLGISLTPIIASLGITSRAVALALQPTLENFFSGVQLVIDKPIRVGDFVELESGEQGFVEKIGWRSTWIKMLPNNIVIMPNGTLSKSRIINYYYPVPELSVPVDVGVHYNSDLEHVERVTLEVAREILRTHKWGVPEYNTFVVFHTFDSSSINFTVMLRTREYFNRFFIKSEFIKALHRRYAEEGIVIPYPIRAINTTQERADPPAGG